MTQRIDIYYFFDHRDRFPFDILGLSRPGVAPLHSYVCEAAMLIASPDERMFMLQKPSLRELRRFSDEGLIHRIVKFCETKEETTCRHTKADDVIQFIRHEYGLKDLIQKRLDLLYRTGVISVPRAGLK
jgi:hypothetical protein